MLEYNLHWIYVDTDTGEIVEDNYNGITLDDFEQLYGNNPFIILEINLTLRSCNE